MWLFCKQGFFSVVEHLDQPDNVLIRARFKGDLEKLWEFRFPDSSGKDHPLIEHTPSADYAWRMVLPKKCWKEMVTAIAADIDYPNFKNRVHEGGGSPRDRAYMDCWWAMRQGQDRNQRR